MPNIPLNAVVHFQVMTKNWFKLNSVKQPKIKILAIKIFSNFSIFEILNVNSKCETLNFQHFKS